MKRKTTLGLLALVVGLLPAIAWAATGEDRPPTKVILDFDPRDEGDYFEGNVISPEPFCERRRKVVVKYVDGRERIGSDRTNRRGFFEVAVDGVAATGTYRARVRRKENVDKGFVCQSDADTYEEKHNG